MQEGNKNINDKSKYLAVPYAVALTLISLLTLFSFVIQNSSIKHQENHASIINISGRQRMLSQRISLLALNFAGETNPSEKKALRQELIENIALMGKSHSGLLYGDSSINLPEHLSPEISAIYFDQPHLINDGIEHYLKEATLIAGIPNINTNDPLIKHLLLDAPVLLNNLDLLVARYQFETEQDNDQLQVISVASASSILLLILIIALAIFRPMTNRIKRNFSEMRNVNILLSKKNRAYQIQSDINEAVIKIKDTKKLLQEVCKIIVKVANYQSAWAGLARNDKERSIEPIAQVGFRANYFKNIKVSWLNTEKNPSPSCIAINTKKPSIVKNILTNPKSSSLKADAIDNGYESTIAIPLSVNGRTLGVFNIFSRSPDPFSKEEIKLLTKLVNNVSLGLLQDQLSRDISERAKELSTLYTVSNIINTSEETSTELYNQVVNALAPGWQYPEISYAKIVVHDDEFKTMNYKKTKWTQTTNIIVNSKKIGFIEVGYLKKMPEFDEGPFLKEERNLLDSISKQLSTFIEKNTAEKETRELDKLKTRFITALTHITQTPLKQIRWSLESLLSGDFGKVDRDQSIFINKALDSEGTVSRLIKSMNTTLDIEQGNLSLKRMPASLQSIVKSIHDSFATTCNLKTFACKIDFQKKQTPSINIDSEKLRAVVRSLFDNALRYTKKSGAITSRLYETKNGVVFKITDTGIGIPESEQSLIFNRFFRASNANKMNADGIGLSLYLAKAIVEAHGGKIGFKSKEREGSTFWFEIPFKS